MAEATIIHTVGTKVWIRDEKEAWIKGEVVKVLDDAVLVKAEDSGAEVKCKPEDAPLQNPHNNRGVDVSASALVDIWWLWCCAAMLLRPGLGRRCRAPVASAQNARRT